MDEHAVGHDQGGGRTGRSGVNLGQASIWVGFLSF